MQINCGGLVANGSSGSSSRGVGQQIAWLCADALDRVQAALLSCHLRLSIYVCHVVTTVCRAVYGQCRRLTLRVIVCEDLTVLCCSVVCVMAQCLSFDLGFVNKFFIFYFSQLDRIFGSNRVIIIRLGWQNAIQSDLLNNLIRSEPKIFRQVRSGQIGSVFLPSLN